MATGNFCYEHRCVVVTDGDYEMDNLPVLGEWVDKSRSYPSRLKDITKVLALTILSITNIALMM